MAVSSGIRPPNPTPYSAANSSAIRVVSANAMTRMDVAWNMRNTNVTTGFGNLSATYPARNWEGSAISV